MADEHHLFLATSFSLNKSYTKQVCIGVEEDYTIVVQLFNLHRYRTIKFDMKSWRVFCEQIDSILSLFNVPVEECKPLTCAGVNIRLCGTDKFKYVIIEDVAVSCILQMREATLLSLKEKIHWIKQRLYQLAWIPFCDYEDAVVQGITQHLRRQQKWNQDNIPSKEDLKSYLNKNYMEVYEMCEKTAMQDGSMRHIDSFPMFFGELLYFKFDKLYKPICKNLNTIECEQKCIFYGEDTVF